MQPSRKAPNVQQTLAEPVGSGASATLRFRDAEETVIY